MIAQNKTSITILPVSHDTETADKPTVNLIQETILNSFFSTKRFTIVDRERLEDVEKEKKLQKTESFMDNKTNIKDGVTIGASYLISPSLISVYPQKILQIKILNVSTGEILATDMVTSEVIPYPEEALEILKDETKTKKNTLLSEIKGNNELQILKNNITGFINVNFPNIIKPVDKDSKDSYEIKSTSPRFGDLFYLYITNSENPNEKKQLGKGVIYKTSGNSTYGKLFESNKKNNKDAKEMIASIATGLGKKDKNKNEDNTSDNNTNQLPKYNYEIELINK